MEFLQTYSRCNYNNHFPNSPTTSPLQVLRFSTVLDLICTVIDFVGIKLSVLNMKIKLKLTTKEGIAELTALIIREIAQRLCHICGRIK